MIYFDHNRWYILITIGYSNELSFRSWWHQLEFLINLKRFISQTSFRHSNGLFCYVEWNLMNENVKKKFSFLIAEHWSSYRLTYRSSFLYENSYVFFRLVVPVKLENGSNHEIAVSFFVKRNSSIEIALRILHTLLKPSHSGSSQESEFVFVTYKAKVSLIFHRFSISPKCLIINFFWPKQQKQLWIHFNSTW